MSNKLNVMVMTKGGHIDVRASQGAKPGNYYHNATQQYLTVHVNT